MPSEAPPPPRTSKPTPEAQPYARTLFAQLARRFIMPASGRGEGLNLIFDIEADNLLATATCVHCIVIDDLASDRVHEYGPSQIAEALAHLARADVLIGHNIQGYDLPVLHKLHGWAPRSECQIVDTLIAARLILPHLDDIDAAVAARAKDAAFGQVRGRYSLEAWGCRLGMPKIGAELDDFSKWTPELQARCVGDVALCKRLYQFLQPDGYGRGALELEHRVAVICDQITADGVPFDTAAAEQLREQWQTRRAVLETRLREQFPEVNNFHSRMQIATVLEARGWQPERRTKKSKQPVINDELLESLPAIYSEFEGLAEHYILGRRLAQLANGTQAWIGNVHPDGRIHGGLIHIGTPHGRAKHLRPNVAQVPNHKKGTSFAAECRALFRHPGDWVFVTCDQSNLQDRGFAHYLAAHDGGAYARTFADEIDQHWQTAIALGLVPEGTVRDRDSKVHTAIREGAKTFRYAFLFGAGNSRAGQILAHIVRTVTAIAPETPLCAQFWAGNKHPSEAALQQTGRRALDRFLAATPGLRALRASLSEKHRRHGWVEGLDGRRIPTEADYKALNRIVTAAEAVICKRWLSDVHAELCSQFHYGPDGDAYLALWVHDEIVICCRPAIAERVGEILIHHARKAGEPYGFRVPLDAVCGIGRDWAGTPLKTTPDLPLPAAAATPEVSLQVELTRTAPKPTPPKHAAMPDGFGSAGEFDEQQESTFAAVSIAADSPSLPPPPPQDDPSPADNRQTSWNSGNGDGRTTWADENYGAGESSSGATTAIYVYKTETGAPFMRVRRTADKKFPTEAWMGTHWEKHWPARPFLPYRLPELMATPLDADVDIFEGEKDCERAAVLGLIATCNCGGASKSLNKSKWWPELNRWFEGRHRVFVHEDNDEPGRMHTACVMRALAPIVKEVIRVSYAELPEGGDFSDWVNQLNPHTARASVLARREQARKQQGGGANYVLVRACDIVPRAMDWVWLGHLLRGSLELMTGIPGLAKSQVHCQYAACVTTGRAWPDGTNGCPPGNVIMLTAEDCLDQILIPRLLAAKADLERIYILKRIRKDAKERMFLLNEDIELLAKVIASVGDVRLTMLDPITAYMGGRLDSHRATDVRSQLGPLMELAERADVAFSAITHPSKNASQRAIDHFIGSQAFIAAARIGHLCVPEMEEGESGRQQPTGRKLFTNPKNNPHPAMPSLAYRITQATGGVNPETGGDIPISCITWEDAVALTADEAVAAASPAKRNKSEGVVMFLLDMLANGPVPLAAINERATAHGYSKNQLDYARRNIGATSFKEKGKFDGRWFLALPQHAPRDGEDGETTP